MREDLFYGSDYEECFAVLRFENTLGDGMIEEAEQAIVESIDIEEQYGFGVKPEILPGEDLEEFFEGAVTAGESEEGVCLLGHECFAGVHGVYDVKLGDAAMGDLEIDENFGNDAGDVTSGSEGRVGDDLHEADVGSAIDETNVADGDGAA